MSEDEMDVASVPGPNSDDPSDLAKYLNPKLLDLYEVFSYRHAAAILANSCPNEFDEIQSALIDLRISSRDIGLPGGNESTIPKRISKLLRPRGWVEARVQGDLVVRMQRYEELDVGADKVRKNRLADTPARTIHNFIDGHKIDYVKGKVAFDLEWNSKDQTFDRDLYAFRAFHECSLISAGVMVTRSASLSEVFAKTPMLDKNGRVRLHPDGKHVGEPMTVRAKYGASTTWMGKLLYRLNAGRNGGCPVLAFGITPKVIE